MPAKHVNPPRLYYHARNDWAFRHGISPQQAARDPSFKAAYADVHFYMQASNKAEKAHTKVAALERLANERPLTNRERRQLTQFRRQVRENSFDRSPTGRWAQAQIRLGPGIRPATATYSVGDTP